jgi:D-glycero-D-manno-heptose 1,7-bisphosphate phosphatase
MIRALFLDRDGTINETVKRESKSDGKIIDDSPFGVSEFKIKEGASELVKLARGMGYKVVVVTNQPSILKGEFSLKDYEDITTEMCKILELNRSDIFECLHKEGYSLKCKCRKPESGLFLMAKGVFDIDLKNSIMVGDSWKDIQAAKSVGVGATIFIRRSPSDEVVGNQEDESIILERKIIPDFYVNNLGEVSKIIKNK